MKSVIRAALIVASAALAPGAALATRQTPAAAPATSGAQPKAAPKKQMPAPITAAFARAYPNAVVKNVARDVHKGVTTYEVESIDNGMSRDIVYTPEGAVVEIEEGIAVAEVPAAVHDAVMAKHPRARISKAERLTRGSQTLYEIQYTDGGAKHSVELDANGAAPKSRTDRSRYPRIALIVNSTAMTASAMSVPRSLNSTVRHGWRTVDRAPPGNGVRRGSQRGTCVAYASYSAGYCCRMNEASHPAIAPYWNTNTSHATGSIHNSPDQTTNPVHRNQLPT